MGKPQHYFVGLCIAATSYLGVLFAGPAYGQVTVSPLVIETEANRNQSQGIINITNEGNEAFRARIYAEPFTYDREKGFQSLKSDTSDLSPYLQFAPREMTVPPGTTRRVRFIARLAPDQPQGEYRSVLFTERLSETLTADGKNQVSITTRIGVTVYVRQGDIAPEFSVLGSRIKAKEGLQLLVKNSGQASAQLEGSWILQQSGQSLHTGSILPTTLIKERDRYVGLDSPDPLASLKPGDYQLTGELTWKLGDRSYQHPFSVPLSIPFQSD